MTIIGEYNPDGTVKTNADECALTGKIVLGEHHAVQRISGTNYFYRYLSDQEHHLSPEKRAEIEALAGKPESPAVDVQKARRGRYSETADNNTPEEN